MSAQSPSFARRCLAIARALLACPTAPLFEDLPAAHIRGFVAARRALGVRADAAGNLRVSYPARGGRGAPLVLVAHMDHPGFRVAAVDGRTVRLEFLGGVAAPHARAGMRVRLFRRGAMRSAGVARLTEVVYDGQRRLSRAVARVVSGSAGGADFAMWDLPACVVRDGRLTTRSCDDTLGCAAALCLLDELARARPQGVCVHVLFTRAEELGFLGALEAIRLGTVPRRALLVSLETSKALPEAPQGGGVIVRVGDRESTFDPATTLALVAAAKAVARETPEFRWQRRLMDGGACEATPFCVAGYRASGVALPLGNYHNMGFTAGGRPEIAAEHVLVRDYLDEVRLLRALAWRGRQRLTPDPGFRAWLRGYAREARTRLARRS